MTLSLFVMGPCLIKADETWLVISRAKKIEALLIYLALEMNRPHSRTALDGFLFPEMPDKVARANLRQTLTRLQKAIKNQEATPPYLLLNGEALQFNAASDYYLDTVDFEKKLNGCCDHAGASNGECLACINLLVEAIGLYRGSFLDGFFISESEAFERWLEVIRERLRRQVMGALQVVTDYYERRGDYKQAVGFVQHQLKLAPWQEKSHCQLMRLLARQGERGAALRQYQGCCKSLLNELGVEPSDSTKQLALHIQVGGEKRPHNLPSLSGRLFIGRQDEQGYLRLGLLNPQRRLLTVLGPGGIGKTHLALRVAWTVITDYFGPFMDGVFFISLSALESTLPKSDTSPLVMAMVQALNLPLSGTVTPQQQLLRALQAKECLLIIENGEYLGSAGIAWILEIIQHTESVKLLLTSRQRLNILDEWVLTLKGLPFPKPKPYQQLLKQQAKENVKQIKECIKGFEAIQLFIKQAQQVVADMNLASLSALEQIAIVDICQQAEGHPLAIKLAAAWVNILSCYEIAEEIRKNLDILATEHRDLPARHRNIRAVFEHSWQLLTKQEQCVLGQLAIFRGSFKQEAAEAVAQASLPILSRLVNKSLVQCVSQQNKTYYQLHPLLQQFVSEKVVALETELGLDLKETRNRHACYYGEFLQQCESELNGAEIIGALQKMQIVIENIQLGWRWAIEQKKIELVSQYVNALHSFYGMREWWHKGLEMFSLALTLRGENWLSVDMSNEEALFFTGLLSRLAEYHYALGHLNEAETLLMQSQGLGNWVEEPYELALTHEKLGMVAYRRANYKEAVRYLEFSLQVARDIDHTYAIGHTLMSLGAVARDQGDYLEAKQFFSEAWQAFGALENEWGMAHAQRLLAEVLNKLGEVEVAHRYNEVCLKKFKQLKNPVGQGLVWVNLAEIAHDAKAYVKALEFYEYGLRLFESVNDKRGIALTLEKLGQLMIDEARWGEALGYLERSFRLSIKIGDVALCFKVVLHLVELLAQNAYNQQRQLQISQLLGFVYYHPDSSLLLKERVNYFQNQFNCLPLAASAASYQNSLNEIEQFVNDLIRQQAF